MAGHDFLISIVIKLIENPGLAAIIKIWTENHDR
jgi:hypothetical protein